MLHDFEWFVAWILGFYFGRLSGRRGQHWLTHRECADHRPRATLKKKSDSLGGTDRNRESQKLTAATLAFHDSVEATFLSRTDKSANSARKFYDNALRLAGGA